MLALSVGESGEHAQLATALGLKWGYGNTDPKGSSIAKGYWLRMRPPLCTATTRVFCSPPAAVSSQDARPLRVLVLQHFALPLCSQVKDLDRFTGEPHISQVMPCLGAHKPRSEVDVWLPASGQGVRMQSSLLSPSRRDACCTVGFAPWLRSPLPGAGPFAQLRQLIHVYLPYCLLLSHQLPF